MNIGKALGSLGAVVLLSSAALADSSMSTTNSDQQINEQVTAVFQQHSDLGVLIKSHTKNGVVYITGTVPTSLQKSTAEELAGSVAGVKKVVDNAGTEKGGG